MTKVKLTALCVSDWVVTTILNWVTHYDDCCNNVNVEGRRKSVAELITSVSCSNGKCGSTVQNGRCVIALQRMRRRHCANCSMACIWCCLVWWSRRIRWAALCAFHYLGWIVNCVQKHINNVVITWLSTEPTHIGALQWERETDRQTDSEEGM